MKTIGKLEINYDFLYSLEFEEKIEALGYSGKDDTELLDEFKESDFEDLEEYVDDLYEEYEQSYDIGEVLDGFGLSIIDYADESNTETIYIISGTEEDLKYFENNYYFKSYCDLTIYDDSDIERIVSEKLLERYF